MGKAINYLSLARKGGLVDIGESASGQAVRQGRARLLTVAADASENARKRAGDFAKRIGSEPVPLPYSKEEISRAVGRPGCSMAAFTDAGIAAAFMRALADEYGAEYEAAAQSAAQRARALRPMSGGTENRRKKRGGTKQ